MGLNDLVNGTTFLTTHLICLERAVGEMHGNVFHEKYITVKSSCFIISLFFDVKFYTDIYCNAHTI